MESVPTVAIRNLRFGWPKQPSLLWVEAFDIAAGEMVLVQGPSGCGKTTLLGLIAGVIAARSEGVRVLGHELASLGASERDRLRGEQMGVIFQQFNLLPFLSVMDNVLLPTRLFAPRREAAIAAHGDHIRSRNASSCPVISGPATAGSRSSRVNRRSPVDYCG